MHTHFQAARHDSGVKHGAEMPDIQPFEPVNTSQPGATRALRNVLAAAGITVRDTQLHASDPEFRAPSARISIRPGTDAIFSLGERSITYRGPGPLGYPEIKNFLLGLPKRAISWPGDAVMFLDQNAFLKFARLLRQWVIPSPDMRSRFDSTKSLVVPTTTSAFLTQGVSLPVPQGVKPTMTNRPTADADLMSLTFDVTDHEGNVLGMLTYGMRHAHGLDGITGVLDTLEHHASVFMPDPSFMAVRDRASAELLHRMLVATGMVSHHRLCGVVFVPSAGYPALELAATA